MDSFLNVAPIKVEVDFDRVIFPFPGKVKSTVWEFFGFYKDGQGLLDKSKAICKLCRKAVSYTGNTTNLRCHVVHRHKGEDNSIQERVEAKVGMSGYASPYRGYRSQQQTAMPQYLTQSSTETNEAENDNTIIGQPQVQYLTGFSKEMSKAGNGDRMTGQALSNAIAVETSLLAEKVREKASFWSGNPVLMKALICDLIPLECLDSSTFKELLKFGYSSTTHELVVPNSSIMKKILLQHYEKGRNAIKLVLNHLSLSQTLKLVIWKTVDNDYLSVSVNVLRDNWKVESFLLETYQLESGYNEHTVAELLQKVANSWKLSKQMKIVSDNNEIIKKAALIFESLEFCSLGVAIENSAKAGLEIPTIQNAVKHAREITQFFSKKSLHTTILNQKQKMLHLPIQGLPEFDVNSWRSVLEMSDVYHQQSSAILAALLDPRIVDSSNVDMLSAKQQALIEGLLNLYKPLAKAVTLTQEMKYATLSIILPVLRKLESALSSNDYDSQVMIEVKNKILGELKKPYRDSKVRESLQLCSLLDPRYKDLKFVNQSEQEVTFDLLKQEAVKLANQSDIKVDKIVDCDTDFKVELNLLHDQDASTSSEDTGSLSMIVENILEEGEIEGNSRPTKRLKKTQSSSDPMNDWLADVVQDVVPNSQKEDSVAIELARYTSEVQIPSTSSPTVWWKDRRKMYPILTQVAKGYIALPAILSSRTEQQDRVYNRQRQSVSRDNMEMMLFLNANFAYLDNTDKK